MNPIIKNIQGKAKHIGKLSDKVYSPKTSSVIEEIERLNGLLKRAVMEERYEDAANLKRKIKELTA